jgi:putative transposase
MRTSLALRQGICCKVHSRQQISGVPDILYADNGSDFTFKHLQQVAADFENRLVFSILGKPQGRDRIERFFRTVNDMFLCYRRGYRRHKKRAPSLSLNRFEERFRQFVFEIYHRRPNADVRFPPFERWEEGTFLSRMPESHGQLDLLLMHEVLARKTRRDGTPFQGLRYLSLTMTAYVGEDATIRFNPRDIRTIRLFYRDRFLCRATIDKRLLCLWNRCRFFADG